MRPLLSAAASPSACPAQAYERNHEKDPKDGQHCAGHEHGVALSTVRRCRRCSIYPAQQARIADYLVAHPDVLIEVSKKLQARQQTMQQQTYLQSALNTHRLLMQLDGVPVKAPGDSKAIVTEFFNYDCITCSMMAPVMENEMTANAGVRFAFRDWTTFAARYSESAQASRRGLSIYRKQGADAYIAFHNGIYRTGHNEGKLTAEDIEKTAAATGADLASDDDNAVSGHITENNAVLAEMLGLPCRPQVCGQRRQKEPLPDHK